MRRPAPILAIFALLAATASGCGREAPAAASQDAGRADDLAAEVKALRELVPDQAHIMADVGHHFTNLGFAGKAGNRPLADFDLAETKSHLRWAVRAKPIRKDGAGREVNLGNILDAFENSQLTLLKKAVDAKDGAAFEAVDEESLSVCYARHEASDKPYPRPQIPAKPEAAVIHFDPKADRPL